MAPFPSRTKYYYHGKLSEWDERSSAGRYVRENCRPLHRYIAAPENKEHRQLFDLISRLLEYDPSSRMTLAEALEHPFFEKLAPELRLHALGREKKATSRENNERRRSSSCSDRSSASSASSGGGHHSDHHRANHGSSSGQQSHHSQLSSSDRKRNGAISHKASVPEHASHHTNGNGASSAYSFY